MLALIFNYHSQSAIDLLT